VALLLHIPYTWRSASAHRLIFEARRWDVEAVLRKGVPHREPLGSRHLL
jgi:hypothetical protein